MADESTDEGNVEQFAVFSRFMGNSNSNRVAGKTEHYLGLINVDEISAKALMNALNVFLLAKGLDITKAYLVAFDGCNTMSGCVKVVQRQFKHQSLYCEYVNCRNHKLALCFKHLMKKYPILEELDSCLVAFSKLFDKSAMRQ